jgi:hypothetical protein
MRIFRSGIALAFSFANCKVFSPRAREQRSSTALTVVPAVFGTWTKASNGRGAVCWVTSWIVAVTMRAYTMLRVAFR